MTISNASQRLQTIMLERGLKQVDILEKSIPLQKSLGIKMGKSALSQYVNGKSSPDQKKLYLLAETLGVNEAWLMGYDVDKERNLNDIAYKQSSDITSIYNKLEKPRQEKVYDFASEQLDEQNNIISIVDKIEDDYIIDYVEGLVSAGHGAYQEDNLHMEVQLKANKIPDKYDTIAKVAGNSMEPLIKDNDLLFISITSQVDPNDIGIFQINGENFVKKFKKDFDGTCYLQSINKAYEEIILNEDDDIRTIGLVEDIYR